jgi:hypothetical protein
MDERDIPAGGAKTRRSVLRAGVGLFGAGAALGAGVTAARAQTAPATPPAPAPGQKLAQAAVQYQNHPNNGQLCSICVNFQAPNACAIVEGKINPVGWCVAFAPKA